ncbi:tetratricopeptide repeat protein [Nannocystis bainbridge]|uniref:Tetratricopeptide repeat protein n=1 Tax=Nannocystis bainbridge TaxID=2995303 RepID=A0ABT5E916_9BACT|nr:tetratricopeptide repeat protein [Nannocystis bainbridge]MDC0721839.1 hypothetical protein [Nannocystis bainbridge]
MAFNRDKALAAAAKYAAKGQHDRAAKEYAAVVEADPSDIRSWLLFADALRQMGDTAGASERFVFVGKHYTEAGEHQKALAVYRQVLQIDSGRLDVQSRVAALYKELGRIQDAIATYEFVAQAYFQSGQVLEGLEGFRMVAELDPGAVGKRLRLAELYSREGMVPQAVEHFRLAADKLFSDRRIDDYIRVAERLIYHKEDDLPVLRSLARIYLSQNENRRALVKLNALLRSAPADPEGLELLADTFVALGKQDKSVSVLQELAKEQRKGGRKAKVLAARVLRKAIALGPENADELKKIAADIDAEIAALPVDPKDREEDVGLDIDVVEEEAAASQTGTDLELDVEVEDVPSRPFAGVGANLAPSAAEEPEDNVGDIDKLLLEVRVYIKYKMFEHALGHLDSIFVRDASNTQALELQASILESLGRNSEAADTSVRLAQLVAGRDLKLARDHLGRALRLAPNHTKAEMVLTALEASGSQPDEAAPLVRGTKHERLAGDAEAPPPTAGQSGTSMSSPADSARIAALDGDVSSDTSTETDSKVQADLTPTPAPAPLPEEPKAPADEPVRESSGLQNLAFGMAAPVAHDDSDSAIRTPLSTKFSEKTPLPRSFGEKTPLPTFKPPVQKATVPEDMSAETAGETQPGATTSEAAPPEAAQPEVAATAEVAASEAMTSEGAPVEGAHVEATTSEPASEPVESGRKPSRRPPSDKPAQSAEEVEELEAEEVEELELDELVDETASEPTPPKKAPPQPPRSESVVTRRPEPPRSESVVSKRPPPPRTESVVSKRPPPPQPRTESVVTKRPEPPRSESVVTKRPEPPRSESVVTAKPVAPPPEAVPADSSAKPEATQPEAVAVDTATKPEATQPEAVVVDTATKPEATQPEAVLTDSPAKPEASAPEAVPADSSSAAQPEAVPADSSDRADAGEKTEAAPTEVAAKPEAVPTDSPAEPATEAASTSAEAQAPEAAKTEPTPASTESAKPEVLKAEIVRGPAQAPKSDAAAKLRAMRLGGKPAKPVTRLGGPSGPKPAATPASTPATPAAETRPAPVQQPEAKPEAVSSDSQAKALEAKPEAVSSDSQAKAPEAVSSDSQAKVPEAAPADIVEAKPEAAPADTSEAKPEAVPADSQAEAVPSDIAAPTEAVPADSQAEALPSDIAAPLEAVPADSQADAAPSDIAAPTEAAPSDSQAEAKPEAAAADIAAPTSEAAPSDSQPEAVSADSKVADLLSAELEELAAVEEISAEEPAAPADYPDITDEVEELRFFISSRFEDDAQFTYLELQRRFPGHPALAEFADRFATGAKLESAAAPVMIEDTPPPVAAAPAAVSPGHTVQRLDDEDDDDDFLSSIFDEPSPVSRKKSPQQRAVATLTEQADAQTYFDLGMAYHEMGLIDDALAQFGLAAADSTWQSRAKVMIADLRILRGEPSVAVAALREAIDSANDEDERDAAQYRLAEVFTTLGDTAAAAEALRDVSPGYRDRDELLAEHEG